MFVNLVLLEHLLLSNSASFRVAFGVWLSIIFIVCTYDLCFHLCLINVYSQNKNIMAAASRLAAMILR